MDRFACGYCGASQLVERRGGTVSLRLVTDAIKLVQVGTDKTAAELALKRLSGDFQNVEFEFQRLQFQLGAELRSNQKLFTWLWVGGIVFCFFIGAGGGPVAYFALLLGIGGTVAVLYFLNKQNSIIRARYSDLEREVSRRGNAIRRKIDQNRAFVDN